MTIKQAAQQLRLSEQLLRVWIQKEEEKGNSHPFGVILRSGKRKTYFIQEDRMKAWCEGRL